jgi:hypothetical protein
MRLRRQQIDTLSKAGLAPAQIQNKLDKYKEK